MKCHYEVLDVPRTADLKEIKAAYKKLALKYHPDKNLDDIENAKTQFLSVQQAYEVLSDPQERAWYDNHREQILRGSGSGYEDNYLDVFQYFSATCYKGYGDDEAGFYGVYGDVFKKLAEEEREYMERAEFCEIPEFGNSQSDYEEVVKRFYDYWLNFSTKKTYVWVDPYDIKDIRDRRTLKLAEKENKKVRMKAKKERNDEIRALVSYVRKRDKRVQAHSKLVERKILENREKQEKIRRQKILERNAELERDKSQADWTKFERVKEELESIEKQVSELHGDKSSSDGEDDVDSNLYCVACNKVFKTEKAFENHESSKKHLKNVEQIKLLLEEDEENFGPEVPDDKTESCSEVEVIEEEVKVKEKKKKKQKVSKITHSSEEDLVDILLKEKSSDEDDFDLKSNKKSTKKRHTKANNKSKKSENLANGSGENSIQNEVLVPEDEKEECIPSNSKKKNKKKIEKNSDEILVDTDHNCVTCKASFPSKNKLFQHLKKTGHGVYLPKETNDPIIQSKHKNKK